MSSYSIMHTQASSSSLYGALTPMAKGDRHVVPGRMEEVTARGQRSQHNTQRDDLPSRSNNDVSGIRGSVLVDLPRAGHSTSLGSSGPRRQSQPIAGDYSYSLPSHTPSEATSVLEEAQGNSLCDRMDDFHFSPQLSERQGRVEQGRTHASRNATSSAKMTASFDGASSRTARCAYPAGEASSFGSPSAGDYPTAVYPVFIPGHEHLGPSDQAWRGDASTQELVHSTSTISGFACNPSYGFDECRVYSGEESSSSYDPLSFADEYMQNSAPMGRTGQSTTSPLQHPQALPRSVYDVDMHAMSRKSDCGNDSSHLTGTMATAVESDAVYDQGGHIQATSRLVGDRDRQSGQSQAPSFAHCQYQSQPPHPSQHLLPRNSSDLSYAYIPAASSQPLRSDADYPPVPNPGSDSDPSPASAPGRSVTGLTTCSSATHLQPHSAPPVLHERSCSPFLGDCHSPVRQLNAALPPSSPGRSPQLTFRHGLPRGPRYERDFSASAYMDESEMRTEGWSTTLFRQPVGLSQVAPSARPVADLCRNAYEMSMPVQPSSLSVGTEPTSRHIRRWSSVSVGSTPTSRLPTASQTTGQSSTTRLRRHSQVGASAPSLQRSTGRGSSQSPSPTPGPSHMPTQAEAFDTTTQGIPSASSTTTASGNPQDHEAVVCDGFAVDEESVRTSLQKPDKLLHVYECFWDRENTPCGMWIEGDQPSIADHLQHFHGFKGGETTTRCLWRDCPKPNMKGTSIARHVVTHVGFRIKCDTCKHEFARGDACNRAHIRSHCTGVAQPMYGDLQRVLDARKVDPSRPLTKKRRLEEL